MIALFSFLSCCCSYAGLEKKARKSRIRRASGLSVQADGPLDEADEDAIALANSAAVEKDDAFEALQRAAKSASANQGKGRRLWGKALGVLSGQGREGAADHGAEVNAEQKLEEKKARKRRATVRLKELQGLSSKQVNGARASDAGGRPLSTIMSVSQDLDESDEDEDGDNRV